MNRLIWRLALAFGVCALAGCDLRTMIQKLTPEKADQAARNFIQEIARGEIDRAEEQLLPSLRGPESTKGLQQLHAVFSAGSLVTIDEIGVNVLLSNGHKFVTLSYQVQMSKGWSAGQVVLMEDKSGLHVTSSHFKRNADSLERLNAFTFQGEGPMAYIVLAFCVIMPVFSIITFVRCLRSKIRRRWLWALFIAFGFITFSFNWGTGDFHVTPVSFLFLSASAFKMGLYAPWVISFAIPVGAIVFQSRRKSFLRSAATLPPEPIATPSENQAPSA